MYEIVEREFRLFHGECGEFWERMVGIMVSCYCYLVNLFVVHSREISKGAGW